MVKVRYLYSNGFVSEVITSETTAGSVDVEVLVHPGDVLTYPPLVVRNDPELDYAELVPKEPELEVVQNDISYVGPDGETQAQEEQADVIPQDPDEDSEPTDPSEYGSVENPEAAPPLDVVVDRKLAAFSARTDIPKRTRALMGVIRAAWTTFFAAFGFGVTWLVDNYSSLHLPAYIGLVIGAICYGLKKFLWPDTLL